MNGFQELAIKNKLSTKELGIKIGVTSGTICDWFNNNVPRKHLKFISELFNVEEEYLNKQVSNITTYKAHGSGFTNKYKIDGNITTIYLERKDGDTFETLIDTEDLPKLMELGLTWTAIYHEKINDYYARSYRNQNIKTYYLHRVIMGIDNGRKNVVHHKHPEIEHNTLDNRKENLEVTTYSRNLQIRGGANKNNNTGVRNVSYIKSDNAYYVQMMKNGERFFKRFPANQFKEACEYAKQKRIELFGKE